MSRPTIDFAALVAKLTDYVPRARKDASLPTSLRGVAADLKVPKSTLADYAEVADVAVLIADLQEIERTRQATRRALREAGRQAKPGGAGHPASTGAPATGSGEGQRDAGSPEAAPGPAYDEALIVAAYQEAAERAANAMQRFIGRHRQYRHVSDVPLVVRDLERTIREIRRALDDLLEVNETWLASQTDAVGPEPRRDAEKGATDVLTLPLGGAGWDA